MTWTSVRSDEGWPSSGCSCQNAVTGVAFAHAGSPATSPSITGASAARTAVVVRLAAGGAVAIAGCAVAMPVVAARVAHAVIAQANAGRT
ncbi:MAG: hypothetical protein Q7R30_07230 [Acidobacteriota bacterium]|nr:hypothetical protein [Acidobacteriota bacterium]